MARLIIGHVSNNSATLWVRGDERYPFAHVEVSEGTTLAGSKTISLESRHGYTGVTKFSGLKADTAYECSVEFSTAKTTGVHRRVDFGHCRGKFRTAQVPNGQKPFSFLLGSCNLHSLGLISNPDRAFEELLDKAETRHPQFMIHCGDQIYYDIPNWRKQPDVDEYRAKYLDAWSDSRPTRRFLTQLPHYMIMDDHEITNDFANDFDPPGSTATPEIFKKVSMKVYREFVHIRHPRNAIAQAYWYQFANGQVQFFVLDTRTERWSSQSQMIGSDQMAALKRWLKKYKDKPKFVVTSIPFVGEVSHSSDKWSSGPFRGQKGELVDFLAKHSIGKLVFLTGDMHNSYHATLSIGPREDGLVIHELMSSPINQLSKTSFDSYESPKKGTTCGGTAYESTILRSEYFGKNSNAMLISVGSNGSKVDWEVFRTKKTKQVMSGSFTL